jgi:hypothetical protein
VSLTLKVPFEVLAHGKLCVGLPPTPGLGDPIEAHQRLYLVLPKKAVQVRSLDELRGKVRIRTPEEALAYCRLRTSPVTWYLWPDTGYMEIVSRDSVDDGYCFGDTKKCELRRRASSGYNGLVASKTTLAGLGIKPPTCRSSRGGYEVHRTLMMRDEKAFDSFFSVEISELVGRDGKYVAKMGQKRRLTDSNGVEWNMEWFM